MPGRARMPADAMLFAAAWDGRSGAQWAGANGVALPVIEPLDRLPYKPEA